jgi:hypothetical protein
MVLVGGSCGTDLLCGDAWFVVCIADDGVGRKSWAGLTRRSYS